MSAALPLPVFYLCPHGPILWLIPMRTGPAAQIRRSTSGHYVYLGGTLESWSSKRQAIVSHLSAETEYMAVANAVTDCVWLRHLLDELGCSLPKAIVVFCDDITTMYMSTNPVHHRRTKHIELDILFVREKVALVSFELFMSQLLNN